MTINSFAAFATSTLMLFATVARAEQTATVTEPLRQFHEAVHDYAQLHRRLEKQLPAMHITEDFREILDASDVLAAALKAARPNAREGDLFTPEAANMIRHRIARTLTARGFLPEEVIAASGEEAPSDAEWPVVNGRFPWMRGAAMWPCIIDALPPLPQELQYRVVGSDLVLVDVHANFVVDILREALP